MPELPEAERARLILESVLGRRIARVDDSDTYVCRPHAPGEISSALVGHEFVSAHRRGKFMWLETAGGPTLGLHLGMAGHVALTEGDRPRWDRFTVEFDDGSRFALRDRRRLGRAVLNPDFSHVGPDAADVGREEFRRLIGSGRAPVKARLLDQGAISGVGNLLADETCGRRGSRRDVASRSCRLMSSTACAGRSGRPYVPRSAREEHTPGRSSEPGSATASARVAVMGCLGPASGAGRRTGARSARRRGRVLGGGAGCSGGGFGCSGCGFRRRLGGCRSAGGCPHGCSLLPRRVP